MNRIEAWRSPPAKPVLPNSEELHLWLIDLDIPQENVECYLTLDERDRAGRMLDAVGARRFVTARGCLRKILGQYLTTNAESIDFRYGHVGKPEVDHPAAPLHFNLSHSSDLALLAVSSYSQIGVDIEPVNPRSNLLAITRKMFGEKVCRNLAALNETERTVRFFQLWTTLEARAKCQGNGVFSQPDNTIPVVNFEPKNGWIAAVALSRGVPEVSKWRTYRLTQANF